MSAEPAFRPQINFKRSIVSPIEQFLSKAWMCIVTCLCLGGCAGLQYQVADPAASVNRTSFYIAAHPDDIELFMARNAWDEIEKSGTKVVFIVFSAGDDGNGASPNGTCETFYHAREVAHIDAVKFWAGMSNSKDVHVVEEKVLVQAHELSRQSIGEKVVFYNLRLPDGNVFGTGYESTKFQSIASLRSNKIDKIVSVDGALELNYGELIALVRGILVREAHGTAGAVQVNIQDEDGRLNPFDHADHTATAKTVVDALSEAPYACVKIARYAGYSNAFRQANLTTSERLLHIRTWATLNSTLVDCGQASTWEPRHNTLLEKQYFRVEAHDSVCNF